MASAQPFCWTTPLPIGCLHALPVQPEHCLPCILPRASVPAPRLLTLLLACPSWRSTDVLLAATLTHPTPPTPPTPLLPGKMAALGVLLHESLEVAGDRMVVVSQSTAALDLVQVRG